jgi:hypothetical protein
MSLLPEADPDALLCLNFDSRIVLNQLFHLFNFQSCGVASCKVEAIPLLYRTLLFFSAHGRGAHIPSRVLVDADLVDVREAVDRPVSGAARIAGVFVLSAAIWQGF